MPITVEIKGFGTLHLRSLVLDLNGTIANNGELLPDIKLYTDELKKTLEIYLVTGDTFGMGFKIAQELGIKIHIIDVTQSESKQKAEFIKNLGAAQTVAIGNGRNDALMIKEAGLGITILGKEGTVPTAITNANIVCHDPRNALDLLIHPKKLIATLRD